MQKTILLLLMLAAGYAKAQQNISLHLKNDKGQPATGASIELRKAADSVLLRSGIADKDGNAIFQNINDGNYFFKITNAGFETLQTQAFNFPAEGKEQSLILKTASQTLTDVTVQSRKPFIQQVQGKTVVNVDAMISNSGTTVLELLEKSPGVLVDRNGGLSLQNKSGVLVMIDDKPTYLSGTDLNNLLGSMSSSQIEQIELITNPSSKYDAAGNAGIINIKTKKIRQKGFNGNFSVSAGHGKYYKNNNSLSLNYRNGRYNLFANYSNNNNKNYTEMYALRTYFKQNGGDSSKLEQPTMFGNSSTNHFLKTGLDYYLTTKTTLGIVLTGNITNRNGNNTATATWLSESGQIDSTINTRSKTPFDLANGNVTLYAKHAFNKNHELSIDADWLNYDINNDQLFINESEFPQYYYDASRGELPASLKILSAKADYVWKMPNNTQFDAGIKTVNTKTDNEAIYSLSDGGPWQNDPGKTNHFLYNESINALYASMQQKFKRWSYQAGMRFETTTYTGTQLGHGVRRDSSFSNDYTSLFPSGFISFDADSNNALTLTVSRRLDRPPFQKLNPFSFIINKYTTEKGNPFTRPQFSWNFELSHLFKQKITTTISYSFIKDYYSQIFFRDSNNVIKNSIIYSTGNVGRAFNIGASVGAQINVNKWWFFTAQFMYNYKKMEGFVWNNYTSQVHQTNFSMNNQFKIGKVYTAEISGFYTGRARRDLQEILYPISQIVVAASRPVLKKKGTLKVSFRDIFHQNGMEGLSDFEGSQEYFWLKWDSRVAMLSFTYRFGKPFKAIRRNSGSAADEIQRVGS